MLEISRSSSEKHQRSEAYSQLKEELIESFGEEAEEEVIALAKNYFNDLNYHTVRNMILDEGVRLDGRKTDEVRTLIMETDILPSPHGSALFTRGETQSLTTVTLGTKDDEKLVDDVLNRTTDRFLLHYNFPPFSTGEARPYRGTGRREIGHGNLALRALKPMMPDETPYVIRVVSDILESNGSSSMATE